MGYHRAGFDVVGIDLFKHRGADGKIHGFSQSRYPFKSFQMDWLEGLERFGRYADAFAVSPPCQRYSITNAARRAEYPDLIGPVREALQATGKPYVIENVVGAPLLDPVELCGCMFNLTAVDDDGTLLHLWRPRRFETNWNLEQPKPGNFILPRSKSNMAVHSERFHDPSNQVAGSYGGARRDKNEARNERHGGYVPSIKVQQKLLGIDWMTQGGMHQSIPPAYTKYIGERLLDVVR